MLVRHNANIDIDELERAIGSMKLMKGNEPDAIDAAMYHGAIMALDVLMNGRAKTYEDYLVMFEARCFGGVKVHDDE